MNPENINWQQRTQLYFMVADRYIKFGITSNWAKREKSYRRNELQDLDFQKMKEVQFDTRWEAELIEQVMKWRLRKWAAAGRHEWIEHLSLQNVVDCFHEIYSELASEIQKHEHIHKRGEERYDFYKQIANYYFKD
jgi:hypothetical protein